MPFTSKQSGAQNGNQNARKDKGQTEGQASPPANGGTNESSTQPQVASSNGAAGRTAAKRTRPEEDYDGLVLQPNEEGVALLGAPRGAPDLVYTSVRTL